MPQQLCYSALPAWRRRSPSPVSPVRREGDAYYPTYGNGGYDVGHYDLDVAYSPATDFLAGHASVRATATESLCSFNLDFVGLTIHRVEVDDKRASWTRSGQELTITPKKPLKDGHRFDVEVVYSGVPIEFVLPGTSIRTGFMATPDGVTVAGQPEVAASWFPVNDHPLDKASYSFEVTVPDGYEVVANGFLRDRDRRLGGTTWEWEAREPMASYLATIDIGFWDVHQWRTDTGLPVYDAVDSAITGGLRAVIESSLARQGEVLDVLGDAFGPYPFSTVAQSSTTKTTSSSRSRPRPDPSTRSTSGSTIRATRSTATVSSSTSSRINGSATTWPSLGGRTSGSTRDSLPTPSGSGQSTRRQATPEEIFEFILDLIPADDPFWTVVIGDPGIDLLFHGAVYVRGAMTLQALRNEAGDDAFWRIIRSWASSQSGGNGTTEEFIALAERVSAQQFDDLFDTWLFTPSKPTLAAALTTAQAAQATSTAPTWLAEVQRRLGRRGATRLRPWFRKRRSRTTAPASCRTARDGSC